MHPAVTGGLVTGVLDAAVRDRLATVETIAVHPDHQSQGIATGLLETVLPRLRDLGATEVDAWTRGEETARAVRPGPGFTVAGAFLHADAAREQQLRDTFTRVYRCRRFHRHL
ncbi:GNAT family N-acetyltransferase [Amycolatopsis sp. Poz14]|nr:GNAT family N-acetyltransferase [Amycolatopsis sp. Poz14]